MCASYHRQKSFIKQEMMVLELWWYCGDRVKQTDSGYAVEVEPTGFADGLELGHEGESKRGINSRKIVGNWASLQIREKRR